MTFAHTLIQPIIFLLLPSSSLKSSYPGLISDHLGDTPPPDMLALPMLLSKLTRLDTLSEKSSKFCSDLVDCVVFVVLHCQTGDDVTAESAWRALIELSQVSYKGQ